MAVKTKKTVAYGLLFAKQSPLWRVYAEYCLSSNLDARLFFMRTIRTYVLGCTN
jgi:hypothetical protein